MSEKALSIEPDMPKALLLLGEYHRIKNQGNPYPSNVEAHNMTLEYYDKGYELNGNSSWANYFLGHFLTRETQPYHWGSKYVSDNQNFAIRFASGIRFLKRAIELDPSSSWTRLYYRQLSSSYLFLNEYDSAIYYGRKELEHGGFADFNFLFHTLLMKGDYLEAEKVAKEWLKSSPIALRQLSEIQVNYYKNYESGIQLMKELMENVPDISHSQQRLGLAYWLSGRQDTAKVILEEMADHYKNGFGGSYDYNGILTTLGDTSQVLDNLEGPNFAWVNGFDTYITHDPFYQNLWDSPKFQAIVERIHEEKQVLASKVYEELEEED